MRYNPARKRLLPAKRQARTAILLDAYGPGDIKRLKEQQETLSRVHWRWYSELAGQRAQVLDALKAALVTAAVGPYSFESFQRAVRYRWSLDPLSPEGSLKDPAGGRFNIGALDPMRYPPFPALYVAKDKPTAIQELFHIGFDERRGLSSQELSLASADSMSVVAIKGSLESVLDLNQSERLKPFVQLISKFKPTAGLLKEAKICGINVDVVRTVPMLVTMLLVSNWRNFPMHVDVPASAQIFGNIVEQSGIEAILYPSQYTKKECLAIYTRNFAGGSSFVELTGNLPPGVVTKRLDAGNCGRF